MANGNKIDSSDIDFSASPGYSATNVLQGNGTFVNKENYLGLPAADGYILSSTALGVRSFIPLPTSLTSLPIQNVVYFSKSGNDSTGLVNRFDKPFLTIAAARVAAVSLTPSITNRVLIVGFSGNYNEKIVLANYVDWDLTNIILDYTNTSGGIEYTIDDNNVSCNSIIYGQATISRTVTGFGLGACLRTQNAGTSLKLYAKSLTASHGEGALCTNGTQLIYADCGGSNYGANCSAGSQTIFGNCSGGASAATTSGGTQVINGNCSGSIFGVLGNGGTQKINGDVVGGTNGARCDSGIQEIRGNVTGQIGASCQGGTQYIFSSLVSGTTTIGAECSSGAQTITGLITSLTVGASASSTGVQIVNGNINATGNGATCSGTSTQLINGNIDSLQDGAICSGGTQKITGNYINAVDFFGTSKGATCSSGTQSISSQEINSRYECLICNGGTQIVSVSDLNSAGGGGGYPAALCSSGSQSISNSLITSVNYVTACTGGTQTLTSCRIAETGVTSNKVVEQTAGVCILDSCTIISTGGGATVKAGSTVKVYGACQANAAVGGGVTQQVGTINVSALVV